MKENESYLVDFEGHSLVTDIVGKPSLNMYLLLHGAGNSNKAKFQKFREDLWKKGLPTLAFDMIGHGETGDELLGSSLQEKVAQARAVITHFALPEPLHIIGSSMGGYVAIKLTECYQVSSLVLLVPGIYTPKAYTVPFGITFSKTIRCDKSWQDTDARMILQKHKGDFVLLSGGKDEVVTPEIIAYIFNSMSVAKKLVHVHVSEAGHQVLFEMKEKHPDAYQKLLTSFL